MQRVPRLYRPCWHGKGSRYSDARACVLHKETCHASMRCLINKGGLA
jgi:hypothetical protein